MLENNEYKNFITVGNKLYPNKEIIKVKITKYGYYVIMVDPYITVYKMKIVVNKNESAKITWIIDRNYQPTRQFTTYYNTKGVETTKANYRNINR